MEFINKSLDKVKAWTAGAVAPRAEPEQPVQTQPIQEEPQNVATFLSIDMEAFSKALMTFCEQNRSSLMVCGSGGVVLSVLYHSTIMRTALIFGGGLFAYHKYASTASTPHESPSASIEVNNHPRQRR